MTIILKRVSSIFDNAEGAALESQSPASEATRVTEVGDTKEEEKKEEERARAVIEPDQGSTVMAPISGDVEPVEGKWQKLPEIVLFWARGRRSGGSLVVCPNKSMDRLIRAYMVCEVVRVRNTKNSM